MIHVKHNWNVAEIEMQNGKPEKKRKKKKEKNL